YVSIWAGTFDSVQDAEAYFGIPEEVGIYLPPEAFAADFALGDFPPENLDVTVNEGPLRPLAELLQGTTFAASFIDQAVAAASRLGIPNAHFVAILYDFDYRLNSTHRDFVGTVRFIGAFTFSRIELHQNAGTEEPNEDVEARNKREHEELMRSLPERLEIVPV